MLLNNKHYYNLPPQERKDLWKHYKKVYPNMGYTDMVKHFNDEVENYQFGGRTDYFDSDVKKFADGGTDKPKVETVKSKFEMGGVLDGLDNNIKQEASTTSVKINKIPKELIMFPDKYTTDMGSFYKDYSKYLQNKYNVSIDHNSTTASALNIFAYFNPVTDEINYKDKFKRDVNHRATGDVPILIKEIPHKIQKDKYGTASFIYNIAKDLIKYPKNIEKFMKPDNQGGGKLKDLGVYKNPGTLEHEAHSIIEPKLRNDFKYRYDEIKKFNKKQNSGLIKKYEDGGTDKNNTTNSIYEIAYGKPQLVITPEEKRKAVNPTYEEQKEAYLSDLKRRGSGRLEESISPLDFIGPNQVKAAANLVKSTAKTLPKAATKAGKYLTEETALRNTYKLNPWAFKANPEAAYRGIGEAGYNDLLSSGEIRSLKQNAYPEPYFAKGQEPGNYAKGYMVELNPNEPMKGVGAFTDYHNDLIGTPINKVTIDNPNLKILKKDWLKGYKEVPKKAK